MDTLLIIGQTFPEPSTTAAGIRMMQLISFFEEQKYHIVFSSTASISDKSVSFTDSQIEVKKIKLNDVSFNDFIKELSAVSSSLEQATSKSVKSVIDTNLK